MACSQTLYYRRERLALIIKLGGKCVQCGDDDFDNLEFDHISSSARIARYKREAKRGKIQLLCGRCNKIKYHRNREVPAENLSVDEIWNTEAQPA